MLKLTDYLYLGSAKYKEDFVGLRILEDDIIPIGGGKGPSYIDVLLSGVSPLVLTNALGLNYLKLFGGTEQHNIPKEYTQVEYLESSGTQYIDTGIVLNSEATIETVSELTQTIWSAGPYSFWGFMGDGTLPRWGWSLYQNRWLPDLNTTTQVYSPVVDRNKHTFTNTCYYTQGGAFVYDSIVDGVSVYEAPRRVDPIADYTSNTLSAYIFARNNANVAGNFIGAKIYSYKIIQDGILVLDLIPCRRNSDSVLGMYDTVSGNFLTNAGTGTFTAGDDVVPTPETPMDIVSNNGVLKVSPNVLQGEWFLNQSRTSATGILYSLSGAVASDIFPVQSNTTYTVCYDGVANFARWYEYDANKSYITNSFVANSKTITTSSDTKYISVSFMSTQLSDVVTQEKYKLCSVNKGDVALPFMPYGETYADGTVETVEARSKNLYTGLISQFDSQGGIGTTYDYFKLPKENTRYTISCICKKYYVGSASVFFGFSGNGGDSNNSVVWAVSAKMSSNKGDVITVNNILGQKNLNFVSIYMRGQSTLDTLAEYYDIQLEEGSTATSYEPYYYGGSATAEMLLSTGDYKDEQEVLTGSVTRNIGIKVLDGTELWSYYSVQQGNMFRTTIADSVSDNKEKLGVLCNSYKVVSTSNRTNDTLSGTSKNYDFINNNYTNLTDWTAYLADQYNAGTPIIVVYPLAIPTTETVTAQPLTVQQGTNTVEITQASIDNLTMELSYKQEV